uniref:Bis(5'-adenosyl)-triphosphatase n=1 Tax=Rhabditophanes sp. KR3021 TaxID=114890 RepID=A0AC35UA64_9BILA
MAHLRKNLIAVAQLTSTHDLDENFKTCVQMVERAKDKRCAMIFFPECFDFVGKDAQQTIDLSMDLNCHYLQKFKTLASDNKMYMSLGGFHQLDPLRKEKPFNNHLIISDKGEIVGQYHKLHLFDLDIPGKVKLMESHFNSAGKKLVDPIDTPVGKIGLNICYDVRFPELGILHRKNGAQILAYPSAFTVETGMAHWETLMRARAIENQCYVISSGQVGNHNPKRSSYGHSLVVDVLICPLRQVKKLIELTDEETADLFIVAKKVQAKMEEKYGATSSTVSCQDGVDAGQSVLHVHIHIIPRTKGDLGPDPDAIYNEIMKHDKDGRTVRTHQQMTKEAMEFRNLF